MLEQLAFPGFYPTVDPAMQKLAELWQRFQSSRFVVYAKSPQHKTFHPTAPSQGLYNCNLAYQERYADHETAQHVADAMAAQNPGWTFQVRTI